MDGAIVPLSDKDLLLTSGSPQHSFLVFIERPFCPMCQDITSANDDDPFCVLCLVLQKRKNMASEDFYDFSAWMKDLERICITIFKTN